MIRVAIADDQQLVRAGFAALVDSEPDLEVVGEASTGAEAVALVTRTTPDVVLMDIRMPDGDGLWATERIVSRPELAGTHIVIVTTFELDEYVAQAIKAGASGFLVKDTEPVELIRAVRIPVRSMCSPNGNAKCSGSSAAASPTTRSAAAFSSARSPRKPTCRGSCRNSPHGTEFTSSSSPTKPGWCGPGTGRRAAPLDAPLAVPQKHPLGRFAQSWLEREWGQRFTRNHLYEREPLC